MKSRKKELVEERKARLERMIESANGSALDIQTLSLLRDRCIKLLEVLDGEKEEQA